MSEQREHWVVIRRAPDPGRLHEAALVLTAMGIEHRIEHDDGWLLYVAQRDAPAANAELFSYAGENRPPPAVPPSPVIDSGIAGVVGYLLVIWAPPALQTWLGLGHSLEQVGRLDAGAVMAGQWWRTITALTLHADIAHIAGNSLFGVIFGMLVGRYLGSGFGWLLIVLCGAAGNLVNAAIQPPQFLSIGASTATFAALGLLSTFIWRRGHYRHRNWRRSVAPLFAAVALFAYTGVGDEHTDVTAHLTGMAAGAAAGWLFAGVDARVLGRSGQRLAGITAVALVLLAWSFALASA